MSEPPVSAFAARMSMFESSASSTASSVARKRSFRKDPTQEIYNPFRRSAASRDSSALSSSDKDAVSSSTASSPTVPVAHPSSPSPPKGAVSHATTNEAAVVPEWKRLAAEKAQKRTSDDSDSPALDSTSTSTVAAAPELSPAAASTTGAASHSPEPIKAPGLSTIRKAWMKKAEEDTPVGPMVVLKPSSAPRRPPLVLSKPSTSAEESKRPPSVVGDDDKKIAPTPAAVAATTATDSAFPCSTDDNNTATLVKPSWLKHTATSIAQDETLTLKKDDSDDALKKGLSSPPWLRKESTTAVPSTAKTEASSTATRTWDRPVPTSSAAPGTKPKVAFEPVPAISLPTPTPSATSLGMVVDPESAMSRKESLALLEERAKQLEEKDKELRRQQLEWNRQRQEEEEKLRLRQREVEAKMQREDEASELRRLKQTAMKQWKDPPPKASWRTEEEERQLMVETAKESASMEVEAMRRDHERRMAEREREERQRREALEEEERQLLRMIEEKRAKQSVVEEQHRDNIQRVEEERLETSLMARRVTIGGSSLCVASQGSSRSDLVATGRVKHYPSLATGMPAPSSSPTVFSSVDLASDRPPRPAPPAHTVAQSSPMLSTSPLRSNSMTPATSFSSSAATTAVVPPPRPSAAAPFRARFATGMASSNASPSPASWNTVKPATTAASPSPSAAAHASSGRQRSFEHSMQHSVGRSSPQRTNSNSKTAAKPGASKLRSAPINRALLVPKPRQTLPRYRAPAASQVMVTPDHVKQAIEDEKRRVEEDRLRKKLDKERESVSMMDSRAMPVEDVHREYASATLAHLYDFAAVLELDEADSAVSALGSDQQVSSVRHVVHPMGLEASLEALVGSIGLFCFPLGHDTDTLAFEDYCFVLTGEEGAKRYGFCRRVSARVIVCVVSTVPARVFYNTLLSLMSQQWTKDGERGVRQMLEKAYLQPLPRPGKNVVLGGGLGTLTRPSGHCWVEQANFSTLFSLLGLNTIIQMFVSLILERRVLLVSASPDALSACIHALSAVLYPFEWPHVFIPLLPPSLVDFTHSPTPYLIGILHQSLPFIPPVPTTESQTAASVLIDESIFVVDIDRCATLRAYGDEKRLLPEFLLGPLRRLLDPIHRKTSPDNISVANVFLRFFLDILHSYPRCLERSSDDLVFFDKDRFVRSAPKPIREFLGKVQETQMFDIFIEERERAFADGTLGAKPFESGLMVAEKRLSGSVWP